MVMHIMSSQGNCWQLIEIHACDSMIQHISTSIFTIKSKVDVFMYFDKIDNVPIVFLQFSMTSKKSLIKKLDSIELAIH